MTGGELSPKTHPSSSAQQHHHHHQGGLGGFMGKLTSPVLGKKKRTKKTNPMQKEWSKRNHMNLNMGVSTPHIDSGK